MNRIARTLVPALLLAASAASAADAGLLNLVPPDAKVFGGIQLDQARVSPFGQFLLAQVQREDENFRRFIDATGFDPRRNITEVVFASSAAGNHAPGVLLARATYDPTRLAAALRAEGATQSTYSGVTLLTPPGGARPQGAPPTIALLDGSIIAAGEPSLVRIVIDRRGGGAALDSATAAKIQQVSAQNDAWFVSAVGVPTAVTNAANRPLPVTALQGIERASGGVKFGDIVRLSGEAVTKSERDATALSDVIRFVAGIVQSGAANNPQASQAAALLSSLQLDTEGSTVRLSLSLPEADLENLLKSGSRRNAAGRQAAVR